MTIEEAKKMVEAKLKCMERDISGIISDCNNKRCYECSLNYEQGNMGEQKEWLRMAIKALELQPCKDCISRQVVLEEAFEVDTKEYGRIEVVGVDAINSLPPVTPQEPCEDCVSRETVLEEINRVGIKAFKTYNDYSQLFDFVDTLPSVNPQSKMNVERKSEDMTYRDIYDEESGWTGQKGSKVNESISCL